MKEFRELELIFLDKKLSDAVRDLVLNSPCTLASAAKLLSISKDFERDVFSIKKLKCAGLSDKQIETFIYCINS